MAGLSTNLRASPNAFEVMLRFAIIDNTSDGGRESTCTRIAASTALRFGSHRRRRLDDEMEDGHDARLVGDGQLMERRGGALGHLGRSAQHSAQQHVRLHAGILAAVRDGVRELLRNVNVGTAVDAETRAQTMLHDGGNGCERNGQEKQAIKNMSPTNRWRARRDARSACAALVSLTSGGGSMPRKDRRAHVALIAKLDQMQERGQSRVMSRQARG